MTRERRLAILKALAWAASAESVKPGGVVIAARDWASGFCGRSVPKKEIEEVMQMTVIEAMGASEDLP